MNRLLIAMLLVMLPGFCQAWWNKDWTQREQVQFDTSAGGVETKETLSGPAVAVRLHLGNFGFEDVKADGSDLRFVAADDKSELKHYVERFDPVNGIGIIWVKLPTLAAATAAQAVWLYYGNPNAPANGDAKAVFEANSVVFNFSSQGDVPRDDGTAGLVPKTRPAAIEQAGLLGASAVFHGEAMVLPDEQVLHHAAGSALSVSLWVKPAAEAVNKAGLFRQGGVELALDEGSLVLRVAGAIAAKGGQVKPEAWQHVGISFGSGRAALYLDGAELGNAALPLPELTGEVWIGEGLAGLIDALQISPAARAADWFKVAAKGQGLDAAFPRIVAEAESGGGGNSYFGILIGNLTPDAWAIIAILGVMFVIAAAVMVAKAWFVSAVDRGNRLFLRRFRDSGDDFVGIDGDPAFARSLLYRLYESGIHEMRKRLVGANAGAAAAGLGGASINAIKAAIDADMVRETHRLNANMVLLTIAISGGPFLGLLGTVVGVMITFAAIAAAGDVNVNAIAPGIAAALLATVAGLSVAIPSLFGYNYLATRIKNISADMQIFVDEFVTRIAEQYGSR